MTRVLEPRSNEVDAVHGGRGEGGRGSENRTGRGRLKPLSRARWPAPALSDPLTTESPLTNTHRHLGGGWGRGHHQHRGGQGRDRVGLQGKGGTGGKWEWVGFWCLGEADGGARVGDGEQSVLYSHRLNPLWNRSMKWHSPVQKRKVRRQVMRDIAAPISDPTPSRW